MGFKKRKGGPLVPRRRSSGGKECYSNEIKKTVWYTVYCTLTHFSSRTHPTVQPGNSRSVSLSDSSDIVFVSLTHCKHLSFKYKINFVKL